MSIDEFRLQHKAALTLKFSFVKITASIITAVNHKNNLFAGLFCFLRFVHFTYIMLSSLDIYDTVFYFKCVLICLDGDIHCYLYMI